MDKIKKNDDTLPNDISPVRYMMNEAYSLNIKFLKNYEEAKITKDAVLIMEGDDGGQIYVVSPMTLVKCDKSILDQLLNDLDEIAWGGSDNGGKGIYYEKRKVGERISGGMGGGEVSNGVWVHSMFKEKGYELQIKDVIEGKIKKIRK